MAKLPVYNSQGNITTNVPSNIRSAEDYNLWGNTLNTVNKNLINLANQWQKSKDEVENLDGKNKMLIGYSNVLKEAEDFSDWSTPAELEAKRQELTQKLNGILPDVMNGFSDNQNASIFQKQGEFTAYQNQVKLDEIFRNKYQDLNDRNIQISYDTNFNNYITTGNENYKQSFLNDIQTSTNAGFMSKEQATSLAQKADKWGMYHILHIAENNPDGAINALKSGKYNIKPEDYNDTLKSLNSIKTNKKLLEEYQQRINQDNFESEALSYVTGNYSYADKIKYIDEMELNGNISESYASKLRRGIRSENPAKNNSISNAQSMSDILQQVYDLNENAQDDTEYLQGIKNVRENILNLQQQGLISSKDANSLNKQMDTATRKKIAEATNNWASGLGEARKYIENTLPPELRAEAVRNVFYATNEQNTDDMDKKQIKELYYNTAVNVVSELQQNNRQKALSTKLDTKKENKQITSINDGQIIVNPNTGERRILKGGKWQKI